MAKKPTGGNGAEKDAPVVKPVRRARVRKTAVVDGEAKPVKRPRNRPSTKAKVVVSQASSEPQAIVKRRKRKSPAVPAAPVVEPLQGRQSEPAVEDKITLPEPLPIASETAAASAPQFEHELAHGLSPVDLPVPEDGEQAGLGWMSGILILSSLLLLLFNSFAVDKWARALPVSEHSGQIMDAAAQWHGAMDRIDFNLPLETGRSAWHWVKDLQWPGSDDAAVGGDVAGDEGAAK